MKIRTRIFSFHCTLYLPANVMALLWQAGLVLCTHFSFSQNYFQQEVKYTINVTLNDSKHELSASEAIVYINNSPDELKEIYFHLWPNAYKNNETALAQQFYRQGNRRMLDADERDFGFIDSLNFIVDGETVQWKYDSLYIDICKLILNRPLRSGDSITISTPFKVKIPTALISRMGHIGQAYFITQWYPKPAVYDRNGWHPIPYLDQGEFYSEFGSFDVSITLPKNYVVGATGDLQTEEEKIFLEKKVQETRSISFYTRDLSFPKSDAGTKTIRFIQNNVHDFAWFADKRYHVLKDEVELPVSKRKVSTWIMYTNNEAYLWKDAIQYMNDAVHYYSLWVGDYPFNNATAVDGTIMAGGGMEYPNITVIGECGNARLLELTIAHEVGHNWFYGALGSNERENPWMDEGINQFYEVRYSETVTRLKKEAVVDAGSIGKWLGIDTLTDKQLDELGYFLSARANADQPSILPAEKFSGVNYGTCVYYKTALSFMYLKAYLGDTLFDKCMHAYFERWKFKHTYPADSRKAIEETSGKNLSWFFDDLLGTTKKIDYKIVSSEKIPCTESTAGNCWEVTLKNKGGIAGPIPVSTVKDGNIVNTRWTEGFTGTKSIIINTTEDFDKVVIDAPQNIPEINRKNNSIRTSGLFKKWDKPGFRFAGGLEKPSTTQIFYLPVLGWNHYDKTMAGLALYNVFLPEKKFEYVLMPMYSTGTNSLSGGGNVSYNFYTGTKTGNESCIRKVTLELGGQSYHFAHFTNYSINDLISKEETFRYSKLKSGLTFYFNPAEKNSRQSSSLELNVLRTERPIPKSILSGGPCLCDSNTFVNDITNETKYFSEINFKNENNTAINPYSFSLGLRQNTEDKLFRIAAEGNYRFSYKGHNRGFDIRLFAGYVSFDDNSTSDYRLHMDGYSPNYFLPYRTMQDYTFEHVFLGRSEREGILSKQFVPEEGGFKTPTIAGQSNSWLAALNLKTNAPGRLPIKIFADLGWYDQASASPGDKNLMYDYGFEITLIQNIFSIYIPIGFSDDIQSYYDSNPDRYEKWYDRIRFELRFEKMNPIRLIRNIEL